VTHASFFFYYCGLLCTANKILEFKRFFGLFSIFSSSGFNFQKNRNSRIHGNAVEGCYTSHILFHVPRRQHASLQPRCNAVNACITRALCRGLRSLQICFTEAGFFFNNNGNTLITKQSHHGHSSTSQHAHVS
jgi:hypothetical protein